MIEILGVILILIVIVICVFFLFMDVKLVIINTNDLFFPEAKEWMWNYCTPLGKYISNTGELYDLGVYINPINKEVSAAIVYGNDPGSYLSGDLNLELFTDINYPHNLIYRETIQRAKAKGIKI